jgi:hypothetical protein
MLKQIRYDPYKLKIGSIEGLLVGFWRALSAGCVFLEERKPMSKASNNISRKKWILLIAAGITGVGMVICCGGLFAFSRFVAQFDDTPCDEFSYDFLKAGLPPSATVLDERCNDFLNPTYDVTFTMSPEDLAAFQQQDPVSRIDEWQTDTSDSFFSEESWQEKKAELKKQGMQLESLFYGEYSDGSILMTILIDTSDSKQHFVQYTASFVD